MAKDSSDSSRDHERILELEETLAASEQRYRELLRALEHIPTGVEIYDQDGTAAYLNPAMVTMTGLPSAEIAVGKFNILTDAFSAETGLKPLYERAYRGELVETDEFTIDMGRASHEWGTTDRRIWFKMLLVPMTGVDGDVNAVFAIMFETTAERRLASLMEQASRRDGLELIVGGVAHDFHNLLTAITLNTELIVEDSIDSETQALSADILSASEQAVFLSQQLLSYAGRRQERIYTMDLGKLTRDICQVFRQTAAQAGHLNVCLPTRPALAEVDSGQYKQVVMNLLTNGLQALHDEGGILDVELSLRVFSHEDLKPFRFRQPPASGAWHQLRIKDNGVGMTPEVSEQIFEPYFTTKADGHGLGLAATLGIVWNHGGGLAVETAPNKGTTFTILLPLSAQTASQAEAAAQTTTLPAYGRVFLADQSPYVRASLRALLQKVGLSVEEHQDGRTALEALLATQTWPDLVVVEVMLTSMNGLDLLREIRLVKPTLPVLLMGSHQEVGRAAAEQHPYTDFLLKPFTSKGFVRHAEALFAKTRG